MIETIQQVLMRACLMGLAASLAVIALRSSLVRDAISRLTLLWRCMTRFGRAAVCSFLLVGILVGGDKTNNVNNLPPQMTHGGGSFETGFTGLTGLSAALLYPPSSPNPVNPVQNQSPVQTTSEDIARGYRQVCVTTNEDMSYTMPSDATLVGNWHKRGTFGEWMRLDLGDFSFPLGTNDASYSSFSVFNDARIRPMPRDVAHEINAVGAPMLAMQGESRFWTAEGEDGSMILTWENFFLNADTNAPVNAQIELSPDGDFATRSNEVEMVYGRINSHDWDDDGLENEIDLDPLSYDGDFFGVANALPTNANPDAYYWLDLSATGRLGVARISVVCDGPSNLGDHLIVARTNQVCHIPLLAGATYTVQSDLPIGYSAVSSEYAEIVTNSETHLTVSLPLEFSLGKIQTRGAGAVGNYGGSSLPINVFPSIVSCSGGCCFFQAEDGIIQWSCADSCTCAGGEHYIEAMALWEGYSKSFAVYLECGCGHDDPDPTPQSGPYAPSVSVSFGKDAVIFEDAYENLPGEWVSRRSTATTLTIHANGGPNGGVLSVTATNLAKLQKNSGPSFPSQSVAVPADHSITYEMNYVGLMASETTNDVVVSATLTENGTANIFSDESSLTSVRLEMSPVWAAPENPCTNRHVYGVGEKVFFRFYPQLSEITLSTRKLDTQYPGNTYEFFDGVLTNDASVVRTYTCPISANYVPPIKVSRGDVEYSPLISLVEPREVITRGAAWGVNKVDIFNEDKRRCWPSGAVGTATLVTTNYIGPMTVSFRGIAVSELPCCEEDTITGCLTNVMWRTHTDGAGAGEAHPITNGNFWFIDAAGLTPEITNWEPGGELVLRIPIGWHRRKSFDSDEWFSVFRPDYEIADYDLSRPLELNVMYRQRFLVDEDGVCRTEKFGHWISRSRFCRVVLDGVQLQGSHPLW